VNLNSKQFEALVAAATAAGGYARSDFVAEGMRSSPCVAIEAIDLKIAWNLSSVLAEHDPALSRALRGPAVEAGGRRSTLFWPGVTFD